MIGKNIASWLDDFSGPDEKIRIKVSGYLLKISEYYFDQKKVSSKDRLEIADGVILNAKNNDPEVRTCVAYLLGILKIWSPEIESTFRLLLNDTNNNVQVRGLWALGNIGSPSVPLTEAILELVDHPNREVRWRVPWAISQIKPTQALVKEALFKIALDEDSTARMYAFDALAVCMDTLDKQLISLVKDGLQDNAEEVRGAACRVVSQVEGDWSKLKSNLESLFKKDVHGNKLEAVLALCKRWPDCVNKQPIRKWLKENDGYWWAEKLLSSGSGA